MSLYIETLNDSIYEFDLMGLKPLSLKVDSLSPRTTSENVDGADGHLDVETTYNGRTLKANFLLKGNNAEDYIQFRNVAYKLFDGKTYFYVVALNEPYKRWKVKTASQFDLERINPKTGRFEVEFISQSPYAESCLNTLSPYSSDSKNYKFTSSSFSLWNEGDILVDPRVFPLKIDFKGVSNNLVIRNVTTGDVWQYVGSTSITDTISLDGIRSLKNGVSIFKDTNRKLITINSGKNEFEITGATQPFEISFDFRYYYI